jgi:hypothetical protein
MSYDIYGQPLRRGHCEVHPHVAEEYPCSLCYIERERENARQEHARQQREDFYAAMRGEAEYESWFQPRATIECLAVSGCGEKP